MTLPLGLIFMFLLTLPMTGRPEAWAASSLQTSPEQTVVDVFITPDESSLVIESLTDGQSLSPMAEMTAAGGLKWFMVKTSNGQHRLDQSRREQCGKENRQSFPFLAQRKPGYSPDKPD